MEFLYGSEKGEYNRKCDFHQNQKEISHFDI